MVAIADLRSEAVERVMDESLCCLSRKELYYISHIHNTAAVTTGSL
jgi:hypothetical protein